MSHYDIGEFEARAKSRQAEADELKNSVFQYGVENTKLQTERDALQAEVDELKGINQTKETEIIILQKELEKNRSK